MHQAFQAHFNALPRHEVPGHAAPGTLAAHLDSWHNRLIMHSFPIDTDGGPQVILELIYRLKVRDVMVTEVVTAIPSSTLREVQMMMKDKRITGVPILDGRRLVGMVSIGDIIEALDGGWIDEDAGARMSTALIVLEDDMPLSFAITWFNKYGFRRFPVLDKDSSLVGIVTAADVLRALLVEMNREVERLEAGASTADGSGNPAAVPAIKLRFASMRHDFENAGKASAELKKALKNLGVDPAVIRRAAIASYELEMNQVIHSDGGFMEFEIAGGAIRITARDSGPGIEDVEAAMTEGWSTANDWVRSLGFGAGLGLPNAKRSADTFEISSKIGVGTTVQAVLKFQESP